LQSIKYNHCGIIDKSTCKLIKKQKNNVLNTIEKDLKSELSDQKKYLTQVEKYVDKWQSAFEDKDLDKMNEIFDDLKEYVEKTLPIESTMKSYNEIKEIQEILENNNGDFSYITDEALELIEALSN
jgi:histidyl-tRNA synthetase